MDVVIRRERPEEFPQIYDLVKLAFETAKVSNGQEQDFVDGLRAGGSYLPELALVAAADERLIGHIMLTRACISEGDRKTETLLLAPVSVALEHRSKGIGSLLINRSMELARDLEHRSVVLVGDPAYYNRFGFRRSSDFGISHPGIPEQYVLAYELIPGALAGVSGTIEY